MLGTLDRILTFLLDPFGHAEKKRAAERKARRIEYEMWEREERLRNRCPSCGSIPPTGCLGTCPPRLRF